VGCMVVVVVVRRIVLCFFGMCGLDSCRASMGVVVVVVVVVAVYAAAPLQR